MPTGDFRHRIGRTFRCYHSSLRKVPAYVIQEFNQAKGGNGSWTGAGERQLVGVVLHPSCKLLQILPRSIPFDNKGKRVFHYLSGKFIIVHRKGKITLTTHQSRGAGNIVDQYGVTVLGALFQYGVCSRRTGSTRLVYT